MKNAKIKGAFLLLSLLVVVLDQWSKWWVETQIPLGQTKVAIPGLLNFIHVQNTGVAFGMFAANGSDTGTLILTALGLLALLVVGVYYWRTPTNDRLMLTSLALILGGAVGNLIDRIAADSVTDFIDAYIGSYHWYTFNLADSAITIGIALMAVEILLAGRRSAPPAESTESISQG